MKETAEIAYSEYRERYRLEFPFIFRWEELNDRTKNEWREIVRITINYDRLSILKFDSPDPDWARRIEAQQKSILEAIMETQQDLDAGIVTLQADDVAVLTAVTTAGTAVDTSLADLLAKINANPGAPVSDFSSEVAELAQTHTDFQTAITNLQSVVSTATTDDPGAEPVSGTPLQDANDAASTEAAKA